MKMEHIKLVVEVARLYNVGLEKDLEIEVEENVINATNYNNENCPFVQMIVENGKTTFIVENEEGQIQFEE